MRHVPGQPSGAFRLRALLLTLVLLVVPAGALAGCGGQAEQVREAGRYTDRVNEVQAAFERDLLQLKRSTGQLEERADIDRAVRRLSRRIGQVESDLRAIKPPAVAAKPHADLVAAFNGWKAPLETFRRALRDRDMAATQKAKTDFNTGTATVEQQINDALRRINDQLRSLSD